MAMVRMTCISTLQKGAFMTYRRSEDLCVYDSFQAWSVAVILRLLFFLYTPYTICPFSFFSTGA